MWSFVIEIIRRYWQIIVIVVLSFLLYFAYGEYTKMKDKADRFESNYSNKFITDNKQNNDVVTKTEFKQYYAELLDSIKANIDSKIKAKNIQNITHVHNHYIDSSKTFYQSAELANGVFDISHIGKCWGFNGEFNLNDTTVHISEKWFENDLHIVDYWLRRNLFGAKIFPKWGRKEFFRETMSNCSNDSVKVDKIIIKKKREL